MTNKAFKKKFKKLKSQGLKIQQEKDKRLELIFYFDSENGVLK